MVTCFMPIKKMKIPSNVFQCEDKSSVNEMPVCDGIKDCVEGIDEKHCYCNDASDLLFWQMILYLTVPVHMKMKYNITI